MTSIKQIINKMKKYTKYIIIFLLVVAGFFIYNSFKVIQDNNKLKQELIEVNQGYDNNIEYAAHLEDSIGGLHQKMIEGDKFSYKGNPKAAEYFKQSFPDMEVDWEKYIIETLFKMNKKDADNPMIPFAGMNGHMHIDNAKVLNNRWIIAHFTDGTYTGEMLVRYYINKDNTVDFKVLDQTLFAQ